MEKFPIHSAQESTPGLTEQEIQFLSDYYDRLEKVIAQMHSPDRRGAVNFLRQVVNPDAWHVLINLSKAEVLVDKMDARTQPYERELDARAARLQGAAREFVDFVEQARAASESSLADHAADGPLPRKTLN